MENQAREKNKITSLYKISSALIRSIQNISAAEKRIKYIEKLKKNSSDGDVAKKIFKDFELQRLPMLQDIKKAEEIFSSNKTAFEYITRDCREIIGDDIIDELIQEVNLHMKDGASNIESVFDKIEEKTGVKRDRFDSSLEYGVDNYFLDLSITYENISNGLKRTIEELDGYIAQLESQLIKAGLIVSENEEVVKTPEVQTTTIKQAETVEAKKETVEAKKETVEAKKETVEAKKETKTSLQEQSVEDFELGFYDDMLELDEFDEEHGEEHGEDVEESSVLIQSILSNGKIKADEDEPTSSIKPK